MGEGSCDGVTLGANVGTSVGTLEGALVGSSVGSSVAGISVVGALVESSAVVEDVDEANKARELLEAFIVDPSSWNGW